MLSLPLLVSLRILVRMKQLTTFKALLTVVQKNPLDTLLAANINGPGQGL